MVSSIFWEVWLKLLGFEEKRFIVFKGGFANLNHFQNLNR